MNNAKSTRRALLSSVVALVLCLTMLMGTTFAWFTDTAKVSVNTIQSGTLKVDLVDEYGNSVKDGTLTTLNFKKSADAPADEKLLWEPGCTYNLPTVYVENLGNLALNYEIVITGIKGDAKLNEAIEWTISGTDNAELAAYAKSGAITISGHMKDEAGNEYQNLTIDGISITVYATQAVEEYDSEKNTYDEDAIYADVLVDNADDFLAALAAAEDGDFIGLAAGTYTFTETVNVDKAVTIVGTGNNETIIDDSIFDVDSSSADHNMDVTFDNLKFTGESRIIVGKRAHHNGVGGPDVLPLTSLTVTDCYAETTFATDSLSSGKGQFIYLAPVYTYKLNLTLEGNTMINAHTIAGEDSSPIVNGNGTVIQTVVIRNNTFGSEENPCDRYAVKFGRRANDTRILIENNTVYGATTAEKDFYILDLWQSGSNTQNGLDIDVVNNNIVCTPDAGRVVYDAYIEATVNGADIDVNTTGDVLDLSVKK